jgi:hypothetical protein
LKTYRLENHRLLRQGRKTLSEDEAYNVVYRAFRKKLRRRVGRLVERAKQFGDATARWNFVANLKNDHWVQLHLRCVNNSFSVFISGPRTVDLVAKLNDPRTAHVVVRKTKQEQKDAERKERARLAALRQLKKPRKVKKKKKAKGEQTPPKPKELKQKSHRRTDLTPQFGNSCVEWDFCLDLVERLFAPVRTAKYTARQLAAKTLYDSLEKTDWQWTFYKAHGFELHFEPIGPWIVSEKERQVTTKLRILCIKDNKNIMYRRLRKYLRKHRWLMHTIPRELRAAGFCFDSRLTSV